MEIIKEAYWDSNFFRKKIYSVAINTNQSLDVLISILDQLKFLSAQGAYFFLNAPSKAWEHALTDKGMIMYDEKIIFTKDLLNKEPIMKQLDVLEVKEWQNLDLNEELKELSIQAGNYSRFKQDKVLAERYKEMYILWINNSLNGELADKVFVSMDSTSKINGMITCKINNRIGNIGLISVDKTTQGKGVGKELILRAEKFYEDNNVTESRVITQKDNIQACQFYSRLGYKILSVQPIFHYWL